MQKQLEIGKNYGGAFGLDVSKGQYMIYQGGDNWLAKKPGAERVIVTPDTTAKALAYINQPSVNMGV